MASKQQFAWIGKRLHGSQISFDEAGTWEIIEKITEKACQPPDYHSPPYEAVGVFVCKKASGSKAEERAIMKVRMEYELRTACAHFEMSILTT
jgi:hypothetical protein